MDEGNPDGSAGGNLIVNIRGTNGSGKSTVVRQLMSRGTSRPIYGVLGYRYPEAYCLVLPRVQRPVYVLGPYRTPTGGCDRIADYETVLDLIGRYRERGHVVFEGVLAASCWGRLGDLLEEVGPDAAVIFLDTPLEECLARVRSRRQQRADQRPFDPTSAEQKFHAIARIRERLLAPGRVRAVDASSETAASAVHSLLKSASRKPIPADLSVPQFPRGSACD